ncbi:MAG: translation initiation factor IF-2 [Mobilitalea sp.]
MAKIKIFELKNEINEQIKGNIESKDIQDYLESSFQVKKTHSSNLEDNEIQVVKNHFIQASKAAKAAEAGQAGASKPAAPVSSAHTESTPQSAQPSSAPRPVNQAAPASQGQTTSPRPVGQQNQVKPVREQGQQGTPGNRPAGGQSGMSQGQQGYQGQQGGQRPQGQGYQGSNNRPQGEQTARPAGEQVARPAGEQPVRPAGTGYQGNRPAGAGYQGNRPAGQGYQGTRPAGTGYQGNRPAGEGQDGTRPAGTGYQGNRPAGQGYQGNRPAGTGYQGNRPAGEGYQGNRPAGTGYQGNRPAGEGYQGNRPAGTGYQGNRPAGEGYQGNRPAGTGYQGNRPAGEGYQGNRPAGTGYQGNRPAGTGYQGNRPAGEGYQGNRPAGTGYQGNRPAGTGYQGNRPAGQGAPGAGGQRPGGYAGTSNYSRPAGTGYQGNRSGGGFAPRGFEGNKDDDDNSGNRFGSGARKGAARPGERKTFDQQIIDKKVAEKNDNSTKRNRDRINKERNYKDKNVSGRDDDNIKSKNVPYKKGQFIQPKPVFVPEEVIKVIQIPEILTIKELADKMKKPSAQLIKKLFLAGKVVTLNQEITFEEAEEIAIEYDIIAEKEVKVNEVEELLKEEEEDTALMVKRPPVVCVMGHVDHGKTSLLDAIRKSNVTAKEAGGITQAIGAYVVEINGEKITFLDTPGHEAFTSMRMRGAQSTDIAILVVAADDGVMPQTIEAINHAKAAGVQIIVAINKIDKPSANIERVKQELTEYELVAEDWGGDTIFVPVSAHTQEGIKQLLEMILLSAEILELKANPDRNARGVVIEAELDRGRGPVATVLIQKGTLRVGDNIAVGSAYGKVRAMMDDKGKRVKEATPSTPVEIIGLNEVPDAGETFLVTDTDKEARTIAEAYLSQNKVKLISDTKAKLSLDGLFSQIQAGSIKELNLIIKADVQGSVEAMRQSLLKLTNSEVAVRIIHGGVGAINESDVILASASNAIIIGFNVKPDNAAKDTAGREEVDVKLYHVIYNAISDVEAAMKGMLDPIFEERIIGHADIRMTFKASGIGTIAGSYVIDGKVIRGSKVRVYRGTEKIYDGVLASLKRFQDDVKEVAANYECGLVFDKFNEVKEGDKAEFYIMAEVAR